MGLQFMMQLNKFCSGVWPLLTMRDTAGEITGWSTPHKKDIIHWNVFIRYLLKLTCLYLGKQDPNFKFQRPKKVTYYIKCL